jgi:parallel beta-helix repeat protein
MRTKKCFWAGAACFWGMALLMIGRGWGGGGLTLYVSPEGHDRWLGRSAAPSADGRDGPLATWGAARDRIRQAKKENTLAGPVEVLIQPGVYRIPSPIRFGPEDSGTVESPIAWRGIENKTHGRPQGAAMPPSQRREWAVLSGGRVITNWRQEGPLWVAHLPEVQRGTWDFNALYVNGEYRGPARAPNEGFYQVADVPEGEERGFQYRPSEIDSFQNLDSAMVMVINSWDTSHLRIAQVDREKHCIRFTGKPLFAFQQWTSVQRYCIYGAREALDRPGEWYLDRKSDDLYYWPKAGEHINKTEIIAPVAGRLIEIQGTSDQPVSHLTFEGLQFSHANFPIPAEGFSPSQAAFNVGGAIYAEYMTHCMMQDCRIGHIGQYGIELNQGCRQNRLVRNEIFDLGAGGVRIGPPSRKESTAAEDVGFNEVDNNWIHSGGKIFLEGVGVWIGQSSWNTVSHNEICDFDYTGVSIGWSWGYDPSTANHNIIEYNHIHHIGKDVLHDMGGIYSLGISPGTILRNNLIHDMGIECRGIYTDEGSSDMLIENNIVYNTRCNGYLHHYGRENRVINNIFALSHVGQLRKAREEEHISVFFERNIVYCNNGRIFAGEWDNNQFRLNRNCYWDTSGGGIVFPGKDSRFESWQRSGQDADSIVADPLFHDPANGDFRLRSKSPAIAKLGFKPIDMMQIGLYGPKGWVKAARDAAPPARSMPVSSDSRPIVCDFEDVPVGQIPEFATLDKGTMKTGATIEVTDRKARSGKHSLLFQDATGLRNTRNPSLVLEPYYRQGVLCVAFDLCLEPGFSLQLQWRQDPFQVGPDFYIAPDGGLYLNPDHEFFKNLKKDQMGRKVAELPNNHWQHFEILCPLGRQADGTYSLSITDDAGQTQRWDKVAFTNPGFQRLDWLGFFSQADAATACYMDNLVLKKVESRK